MNRKLFACGWLLLVMAGQAYADIESDRQTLERYDAQVQNYQRVGESHLRNLIRDIRREMNQARRDPDINDFERSRRVTGIEERLAPLEQLLAQVQAGETVLTPEMDFRRMTRGTFGTLQPRGPKLNGQGLATSAGSWVGITTGDDRETLCQLELYTEEGRHIPRGLFGTPRDTVFVVIDIERVDGEDKYTLQAINIDAMRERVTAEQPDQSQ